MRGRQDPQVTMLAFVDLEARVPPDHPLRIIKALADQALAALSPEFNRMYAEVDRPSIPPERYLLLVQEIVQCYGIPLAVYTDRHAVFQHNRALWAEGDQTSKRIPTQFARALKSWA